MHPWSADYVDLSARFLDDADWDYLHEKFPSLPQNRWQGCPTCHGEREYMWAGVMEDCECDEQISLHKNYLQANIGELYQRLDWKDYEGDQQAQEVVLQYMAAYRSFIQAGMGVFLYGPFGTGKTMLVALAAKELVKLGFSVYFCTFPEMINLFTKGWGSPAERERFEVRVVGADVLVLDDVGKEFRTKTNLAESTFDHILRSRVVALRPTFITTNMTDEDLREGYGSAILSLLKERSLSQVMEGTDWRSRARDRTMAEIHDGWRRPIV